MSEKKQRGASKLVGIATLLAITISAVFATFALSLGPLTGNQDAVTDSTNIESTIVVTDRITELTTQDAEQMETTPTWSDAQVTLSSTRPDGADPTLTVQSEGLGINKSYTAAPIRVQRENSQVVVFSVFGAVFTVASPDSDQPSLLTRRLPDFTISKTNSIISLPVVTGTTANSPSSIGVDGTAQRTISGVKQATIDGTTRVNATQPPVTLSINNIRYPTIWEQLFTDLGLTTTVQTTGSTQVVTGEFNTSRLSLTAGTVQLSLGRTAS